MKLTLAQPSPILRAVVPLASPVRYDPLVCPFEVTAPNGAACKTQWDVVVRDVAAPAFATVVEVTAAVPNVASTYGIFAKPHATARCVPGPWAQSLTDVTSPIFKIDGVHVDTAWASAHSKIGEVQRTRRFHGRNFVGWATVYDGLDVVELCFDFHAATIGSGPLFFSSLELVGAFAGWSAAWPENFAVGPTSLTLVAPRTDGQSHCLPQRTGRPFRLWLYGNTNGMTAAQQLARASSFALCDAWTTTAAYGAQAQRVPDMPLKKIEAIGYAHTRLAVNTNAITTGLTYGVGLTENQPGGRVDWLQMWGTSYGGVTGGSWREQFDRVGCCTLIGGDSVGVLELQSRAFGIANRMPTLIVTAQGTVPKLEDYLDASGAHVGGWRMSSADGRFDGGGAMDGPFGYHTAAPTTAPTNVADWAALQAYSPIDFQHHDRCFSSLVALAYLTNDEWAKWRLRQGSEAWRMSMHSRMPGELAQVKAHPGLGTTWGRAHGECWSMCCAAYALSDGGWRQRWAPYLRDFVDVLLNAQMQHGLFRAWPADSKTGSQFPGCYDAVNNKPLHRVSKFTEESQLANALACALGSVEVDAVRRGKVQQVLVHWASALQTYVGGRFPDWVAVRGPGPLDPPYVGVCPLEYGHDKYEVGGGIGHALRASPSVGTPDLSALVTAYTGSATKPLATALLWKLDGEPTPIDDTLPLIAALQQP